MKAGKRKDRLFFITEAVSFCLASKIRSLSTGDVHSDFFPKSRSGSSKTRQYEGGPTMKSMYRTAMIIAVFVFLLPLSARSEIRAGSFEVNPYVGYNFFQNSQNLEGAPLYGARLGYNFTKYFGIEVAGQFMKTDVDDKSKMDNTEGQFGYPDDRVELTFYHADLVFHIVPEGMFNPFVVVGFGGTHYSPSISNGGDMPAFNVGIGAKIWLSENIALRFDVQDYMVTEIAQETYHNIGVTGGIVFAFGGHKKPAPEPEKVVVAPPPPPPPPAPEPEKVVILVSEPQVEEKVLVAAEEPKIIVLAFEDVHFDFDKSTLKPEAQTILKRNIQLLKDNPKAQVRIAGYTSASGTEEYNQKLSERRAKSVEEYLITEGIITSDRLSTIGYGESNPAKYEAAPKELYSPAAKANMRVLFEIIVQ
jgi:OOP family OmpA-OmpF porin